MKRNYFPHLLLITGIFLTSTLFTSCSKEKGCTDPDALNYDASAEDDCCCAYVQTNDDNLIVSGFIASSTTWTSDNIYELAGKVVVEDGVTLTIEPGTIIKGRTGAGSLASALVVARGGMINAIGTSSEPIIMTTVLDNIQKGQLSGSNLSETDNAKWGGLIVLGNAPISAENGDGEAQIEGIPADELFGRYGGSDEFDSSGTLEYVSVRHGGSLIGEGNEINGITLGGVGSGTKINYVEVVANLDDGIECFGGSVNISNAIIAYQGDDGIDLDQNYSGTIDNFFVLHGIDTDEALEIDGPEGTLNDGLFTLINGTLRSVDGEGSAADLKSKAQGTITNVTVWGYSTGNFVKIRCSFEEDCTTDKSDAYLNYINGSPKLIWENSEFGNAVGDELVSVYTKSQDANENDCSVPASYQTTAQGVFDNSNNITGATNPTIGADLSAFDGWSWSAVNGIY